VRLCGTWFAHMVSANLTPDIAAPTAMPAETAALDFARVESRQIAIFSRDLRLVAAEMQLDWHSARELWTAGFLSFDPDVTVPGDEAREAEFVFLGSLIAAGLSHAALAVMLRGLRRPFAYDISRIYFDWRARCWRLMPVHEDPEAAFFALLARLDPRHEAAVLLEIRDMADNALDLARGRRSLLAHEALARQPAAEARGTLRSE